MWPLRHAKHGAHGFIQGAKMGVIWCGNVWEMGTIIWSIWSIKKCWSMLVYVGHLHSFTHFYQTKLIVYMVLHGPIVWVATWPATIASRRECPSWKIHWWHNFPSILKKSAVESKNIWNCNPMEKLTKFNLSKRHQDCQSFLGALENWLWGIFFDFRGIHIDLKHLKNIFVHGLH